MEGLEAFEKSLQEEKRQREREAEKLDRRKHRHGHRDGHRDGHKDRHKDSHRDRDRDRDRDSHRDRANGRDKDRNREKDRHKRSHHDRHRSRSRRRSRSRDRHRHRSRDRSRDRSSSRSPSNPSGKPDNPTVSTATRDSWMTAPSALDVDYIHRPSKSTEPLPKAPEPARELHQRELNQTLNQTSNLQDSDSDSDFEPDSIRIDYKFGDEGSRWRMVKLDAVFRAAKEEGRPVEEIALERFGSLQAFDIAREEKDEVEKRRLYGSGYSVKEGPDGSLYAERLKAERSKTASTKDITSHQAPQEMHLSATQRAINSDGPISVLASGSGSGSAAPPDQTTLNRMRAAMMKAKLRRAPDAAKLEAEYNAAAAAFSANPPTSNKDIILGAMESRMLAGTRAEVKAVDNKRGRERGTVVENSDMTIQDMVREERRTRGQAGGEAMRLAERIAKDGKFDNDLEYMDENAAKLAQRVHKSEISLKNTAVHEFQKVQRILDNCPLCEHEDAGTPPQAPVVALATRTYLTLAPEPSIAQDAAVIVPRTHHTNLLECDDDEWEELRNFMKALTRMYHDQGRDVVFYENAAAPHRRPHAALVAVPIPYADGAMVPAYFREAFLAADDEWTQHRKIIDTGKAARDGMGRMAFRRSLAKEMPYFHVWFSLDGGLGHVVENGDRWPRGDLFAREVLGGMMDVPVEVQKKQGRWHRADGRVDGFQSRWRKFDWTRVLV
ncbi:hypothetical protein TD95_000171 [Thielaviopsis punctulata]|uniref:Cwf19-like C-terminal domain-containing protein n=1 Tax=Thielaviopsis punctulata TaxID=72032 RepID=A0A0F4ZCU7_9PEZI|nr:hypothetical protein TD95_000171 [Thielaviopsis punctulata]